jgi:hypothetical protein
MSKMPKIEVSCRFYKEKNYIYNYIHLLISYFSFCKYQTTLIKTERSDTIILVRQFLGGLGILAHFRHFRHFSGLSGLGIWELKNLGIRGFRDSGIEGFRNLGI